MGGYAPCSSSAEGKTGLSFGLAYLLCLNSY